MSLHLERMIAARVLTHDDITVFSEELQASLEREFDYHEKGGNERCLNAGMP
jgi:hypothetical protein